MKPSHWTRWGKGADPSNFEKSRTCKTKGKKKESTLSRIDDVVSTRGTILILLCMYTRVKHSGKWMADGGSQVSYY